jgi:hypothetical protein
MSTKRGHMYKKSQRKHRSVYRNIHGSKFYGKKRIRLAGHVTCMGTGMHIGFWRGKPEVKEVKGKVVPVLN